jgi:hypothetical protein
MMKYSYPMPLAAEKQEYNQLSSEEEESKRSVNDSTVTESSEEEYQDLGQFTSNDEYLKATAEGKSATVLSSYREGNYFINSSNWSKGTSKGRNELVKELLSDEIPPPVGIQHSTTSQS